MIELFGILLLLSAQVADGVTAEEYACSLRSAAKDHIGETFRFRGRFSSDGRERARLDIEGCESRYAVGGLAEGVAAQIDPDTLPGFYPMQTVDGVFEVRIKVVQPSWVYQNDDGVRLNILGVEGMSVVAE